MSLIDTHCHLDDQQFASDRDQVVERALAAGVEHMVAIGTGDGPPDLEVAIRLAERYPSMWATVGGHPHNASQANSESFAALRELAGHPKVIAMGEIGLDYHYDFSPRERQQEVFVEQMHIARETGLPIVIHTREAWDDTWALLEQHWPAGSGTVVLHCFSGGPEEARRGLDRGYYLSYGGIVTFPKALALQEAARLTPRERMLVETDAPYLAPVPHRGKRNEPAFVLETARKLAALRGTTLEDVSRATSENFFRAFPKAAPRNP